jgi:hypothetical protein
MGVTEEDGGAILGGAVPVGSALALATMELEDVVDSTGNTVSAALEKAKGRGMLIYSCAARYWVQGVQITAEQEKVAACIGNTTPYHFIYSAGEIFPEFLSDNKIVNHLQNDSLIICIL